jgi:hypothetical protein
MIPEIPDPLVGLAIRGLLSHDSILARFFLELGLFRYLLYVPVAECYPAFALVRRVNFLSFVNEIFPDATIR